MIEFTLDTSGIVMCHIPSSTGVAPSGERTAHIEAPYRWSDLNPFTQGYVKALFAASGGLFVGGPDEMAGAPAFRDLAPEALAAILRDCAAFVARFKSQTTAKHGAGFWRERNRDFYAVAGNRGRPAFPPLTPYLNDDGKVYLREGGQ